MHRLRVVLVVAIVATLTSVRVVQSTETTNSAEAAAWGNSIENRFQPNFLMRTKTDVADHFGAKPYAYKTFEEQAIAANGTFLETAGSGSRWVYDPVHRIGGSSERGDATGDSVFFTDKPPFRIRTRDLSHLVSAHGLFLGISLASAASALHVRPTDVRALSKRDTVLSLSKDVRCAPYTCSNQATLYFRDGKAIAISLYFVGP